MYSVQKKKLNCLAIEKLLPLDKKKNYSKTCNTLKRFKKKKYYSSFSPPSV